jgi:hypothetical protein
MAKHSVQSRCFTKVEEEVLGTFVHYPIKLAWAITVHKSQGLTLTKQRLMFHKFYARTSIRRIIAFALLRRAYFAFSTANERMNDQDVMDYALNKAQRSC